MLHHLDPWLEPKHKDSLRRLCQTLDSGGYYALARAPYPVDHGEGHIDRVMATVAALLEKIDFHAQLGVKKDRQSESVFELGVAIMVHDLAMAVVALHVAGGPQVQRSLHASIDRLEAYLKKAHVDAVVQGDNLLHAKLIAWAHAKDQSWSSAAKLAWMDQLSADFGCHYLRVWVRLLRLADLLDLGPRRVVNELPSEISWQPDQLIHRDVHLYAEIAMEFPIIEIRSPMLGLHRMPVPNRDTIVKLNEIAQEIQSQIDEIRAWLPSLRLISTLPQIRLKQPQDRLKEIEESVREFLVENSGVGLDKVYAAVRGAAGHTRERGSSRRTHARRIRSNMDLPPEARARCDVLFERLKGIVRGFDRASLQYINRKGRRTLIYGIGINENVTSRWLLRPLSEDALIGEIFALKRTLIIEDTAQDTHGWKPNQDTKDVKSWICVPFISADGPCGLITLDHATPGHFSGADRDALDSFARQNGQLFEWIFSQYATARVARHSELIGDILGAMSEPIDSSVLLRTIVEQVALHLKCAHCTIFLAEPNGEKVSLVPKAACPEPDLANDRQFSLEEGGLAVRVFKTGEAEMHDDATKHPAYLPAKHNPSHARSMAIAPITWRDQCIGVICADQAHYGWFSDYDLKLLKTIGRQAGISLRRSGAIETLHAITADLVASCGEWDDCDLEHMVDKLLRRILDGAILMTGADTGVIYKIRPEDLEVEYEYAPADYQYPKPRKKFPRGLTRTVVRQKRTLPIPDVRNGPYPYNAMPHEALRKEFSSVIVVPLKLINPQRAERVIGVLFLDYRKQHEFPQAEITFLEVLCAQGAAAIRNAELIRDLRAAGLKLTNLDRQLGELHQLTDLKTLIGKVGTDAIEFFGPAVSATIDLYDAKSGRFGTHYPFGKLGGRLRMKPRRNGTGHYVVAHRRPLYYADTHHPPPGQPQPRKALDLLGVVSFAALPLIGRDEVPLGVLFINSTVRLMFGDDIRKTLEVLCSHAVIALENSQTYQRSLRA